MPKEMALKSQKNKFSHIAALFLSFFYLFRICREIDLSTADLGRHISNGKWVFRSFQVLTTNFYSYTYPDFPFVNHHWGSGVLFYGIHKFLGFEGLSLFYAGIGLLSLLLILYSTGRKHGTLSTVGAALFSFPLLTYRTEVRPEILSLCFCAVYYFVLLHWKQELKAKVLIWLPPLTLLWVNLHVCFIFGFLILGSFFIEALWDYKKSKTLENFSAIKQLGICFGLCILATLLNPLGIKISLAPFQIFLDYGYRILENQSVRFLFNLRWYFVLIPYFAIAPLLGGGAFYFLYHLRKRSIPLEPISISLLLIGIIFFFLASTAIRNYPFLGLFSIPWIAALFQTMSDRMVKPSKVLNLLLAFGVTFNIAYVGYLASAGASGIHIGVPKGMDESIRFFKDQKLKGPIFNNYDIGSYLVFYLFPEEKVFVDNRPEAYPSSFFEQTYVPMQEDESKWKREEEKYQFNVIFFAWNDLTPAAQTFLAHRIHDPEWIPVFVDSYALILVKNTETNRNVIERFQIPRSRFVTR